MSNRTLAEEIRETHAALVACDPRIEDWNYLLDDLPEYANRVAAAEARYDETESEVAILKRRIEKLNKRRAADREAVANAEMTLAKLVQVERERDELRASLCDRADVESLNWNERLELSAMRALIRWVMQNPSRCLGNAGGKLAGFTVYDQDLITTDGDGESPQELAEALGLRDEKGSFR